MKPFIFTLLFLFSASFLKAQETDFHDQIILYIDSGKTNEALILLDRHLYENAIDIYAYYLRAIVYEELKDNDKALTNYNIYLDYRPADTEARFSSAILRYKKKQIQLAIEDLAYILDNPSKRNTTSVYFQKSKDSNSPNRIFTAQGAIESSCYYYLGLCHIEIEDYPLAISYFDSALVHSENNPDILTSRALAKEKSGEYVLAIADYKKALEIDPYHILAKYNLSLLVANHYSEMNLKDSLTKIISNEPIVSYPFAQRGFLNFNQNRYKEALDDFSIALKLEPDNSEYLLNRARTYIKLNELEKADKDLTSALELDPSNGQVYFNLAVIAHKKSQLKKAIELLDLAIFYYPEYKMAYVNRAIAYHSLEESAKACKDLRKAIDLGYEADQKMIDTFCFTPN